MLSPSQDLNLPPRKLLSHRSPMTEIPPLHLPLSDSDDDLDPYSTDEFRMYEFKIRRCVRSRSHDWTDCPFAHPGEKARRRDPRRCHYSGTPCAEFRRGACPRGESCEFAHGVFECWLHPARYRTNACKDGKSCKRKVCFFAHTPRQLRVLPAGGGSNHGAGNGMGTPHSPSSHCCGGCYSSLESSPTSTLPPISSKNLFSRFNEVSMKESYEKALMELVSSLEKMGVTAGPVYGNGRPKPKDVFDGGDGFGGPDLKWVDELVM